MQYIIFEGIDSRTMGLAVEKQPPVPLPNSNMAMRTLPGRDGFVTIGDMSNGGAVQQVECFLEDKSRLPEVRAWLRTGRRGRLVMSEDLNHYMDAVITQGAAFYNFTPNTVYFTAYFDTQPWLYHNPEASKITLTAGGSINNPGTAASAPIYRISGSGDIVLMLNGKMVTLEGLTDGVMIDTAAEIAVSLDGNHNLMTKVSGDLSALMLDAGANAMSWSGNVQSVEIEPRWRDC